MYLAGLDELLEVVLRWRAKFTRGRRRTSLHMHRTIRSPQWQMDASKETRICRDEEFSEMKKDEGIDEVGRNGIGLSRRPLPFFTN
jgi:hypothetical protein